VATKKPRAKTPRKPFTVIRDTREHAGHGWDFPAQEDTGCQGTVLGALATGDYSLEGYEHVLSIERKLSTAEFAQNLTQERFTRELERLVLFPHAYVILEFTAQDICNYPAGSGIPRHRWKYIRMTPEFFWKRLVELTMRYSGIQFILAGASGQLVATEIFKQVAKTPMTPPPEKPLAQGVSKKKAPAFRPKRSSANQIELKEPKGGDQGG